MSPTRGAVLPAALLAAALLAACSKPAPLPEPIRAVKLIAVGDSGLLVANEFSGTVAARAENRVGFRVGGKITKRHVEAGQRVKAGQLLATLDPQDLQLGISAATAQVQAAQVQADLAGADFKRFKDLRDQNFISGAELDRREAALKAANATLAQAKAQLSVQGNQAGYASLVSPVSGVIVGVDAEAGMVVAAGTPVMRIASDSGRDAVFAIPEDRLSAIKVGQTVNLRLAAAEGELFKGSVREIAAVADPATRTYAVKVAMPGTAPLGATVYAAPAALSAQALGLSAQKLPTSALRQDGGKTHVWVFDKASSTVKSREVQVATADGNEVVLAPDALKNGEWVVAAGVHVLQQGQKVTVWSGSGADFKQNSSSVQVKSASDATQNVATSPTAAAAK